MNFLKFRDEMIELGCVSIDQIYAWDPGFNRNNLYRWVKEGRLIRLRNGFFSFPDYLNTPNFAHFLANRIYKPSYLSLQTALSFYGIIPETVVQLVSVSTLKTANFDNRFGQFNYQTIKPMLMFGYEVKELDGKWSVRMASMEKAIIDLLYLHPEYHSKEELLELRFDDFIMQEELNKEQLLNFTDRCKSGATESRVKLLLKTYGL